MKKIYSKKNPELLLHQISGLADIKDGRLDLSDPKEFLQASLLKMEPTRPPRPHRHISRDGEKSVTTQECWIVMKGSVSCAYYDTDDILLEEVMLNPGDCSITFHGGHSVTALDDDAIFYEIKTGPYKGQAQDHVAV